MPNRLANETSPYLLQHQNNPVDWYPWGEEALQKAKRENKPIFLSIGYSACHWCHVMEHESFENEAIAATINKNFVPIKVDREERPDLDHIYMNAVQMLTGRGGWPMSVFLTPDLKPFYGGTYWPPKASRGMPGFDQILAGVSQAWEQRREKALAGADRITEEINNMSRGGGEDSAAIPLSLTLIDNSARQLERTFDSSYGGFGGAPKFPQTMMVELLLRHYQRTGQENSLTMVRTTLDRMAGGGIYDHLGGGFARYSVDVRWLVPHFEKMLYDNSLLTGVFLDAHLVTGDDNYSHVVRESLDYILRDMTDPAGAFYSTEDADSEGEEGKFYVWSLAEVTKLLGEEKAATFGRVYDVTAGGNFEGHNILHLPKTIAQCAAMLQRDEAELRTELAESRNKLFEAREKRVRPGRDDKVLVSWNGLMIDSMARAGAVLEETRYTDAAAAAAKFILEELRREDGRLLHTWRNGKAKLDAYLDDYVCLANGLVSLYEATFDEQWIDAAVGLMDTVLEKFADPDGGGFFFTASDHEALITRTKEVTDASTPSGNGMAAVVLLRLGALLGRGDYFDAAEGTLQSAASMLQRAPQATGQLLIALDRHLGQSRELVLVYEQEDQELKTVLRDLRGRFLPNCVIASRDVSDTASDGDKSERSNLLEPAFAGKQTIDSQPTLYICEKFACQQPVSGAKAIREKLDELAS